MQDADERNSHTASLVNLPSWYWFLEDEKILMKFWRLAKTKTFSRALEHVRKYGI